MQRWRFVGRLIATMSVAMLLFTGAALASAAEPMLAPPSESSANRIADGNASEGLSAWEGTGFVIDNGWQPVASKTLIGETIFSPPVFEATAADASIRQTDSLSDLTSAIETGTLRLWVYGYYGGSGTGADSAYLTVEFLNGVGESVGQASQYGPVTAEDRLSSSILVPCGTSLAEGTPITVPSGARAVRVTLSADGSVEGPIAGFAQGMGLYTQPLDRAGAGALYAPGEYINVSGYGGQGPDCGHAELFTVPPGAPQSIPPTESSSQLGPKDGTGVRVDLSRVKVTPSALSFWLSSDATIHVTIKPANFGAKKHRPSRARQLRLTVVAAGAGKISRRFSHRLSRGRYMVLISIEAAGATTHRSIVVSVG